MMNRMNEYFHCCCFRCGDDDGGGDGGDLTHPPDDWESIDDFVGPDCDVHCHCCCYCCCCCCYCCCCSNYYANYYGENYDDIEVKHGHDCSVAGVAVSSL